MKKLMGFIALIFVASLAYGQEMRTKTNEIHMDFKQPRSRTTTPAITWVTPQLEYTNSTGNQVAIEANIASDIPLSSVKLVVSDNPESLPRGSKSFELPTGSLKYKMTNQVSLMEGSNYIEIIAENVNGAKVSGVRQILVGSDAIGSAVSIDRKDYALLFATDTYDYWSDLVNPVYDANSIAQTLKEKYGFNVEVIENANQEEVLVKIREYAQRQYKPQDQLFVFIAGHGQFDDAFGEGYVVAKNSLEEDKAKTTYISHSNLRSYLNNIPCSHILLAMDVCFGGTFDPVIARSRGEEAEKIDNNEFLVRKLSKKTRRYITSGGKEYVSDGVRGKHSPFAARWIEAFSTRGGDDGILTISEIALSLEKIKNHEPRLGEFGDNEKGSDFVFVFRNQ